MNYIIIALAIVPGLYSVSGQSCTTSSGSSGNCVAIQNCAPLFQLVNNPNKSPADFDLLRRSACGFDGSRPKVCCEASTPKCFTPQLEEGDCVGILSCPHIAPLLSPPVSKETLQFIQGLTCQGREQYSVCCGSGLPPLRGNCADRLRAVPPDPRTDCCGFDSGAGNRIIGGNATAIDQYPWLTLIEYGQDSEIKLLCGGALISSRYVLTAAHCLRSQQYGDPKNVRLGEYDATNDGSDCVAAEGGINVLDCADPVVIIPIERSIAHAQYKSRSKQHDIGLIRLAEPAPYTDFIRPICLPTTDITATTPPSGYKMYGAGWGNTNSSKYSSSNIKQHVDLPFVRNSDCEESYAESGRRLSLGPGQFCAGGVKNKDTCKGDSGGPLMYQNGKIWEVVGIVSFGPDPCGMEDIPAVYTKTYEYINWIRENINA